MTVIIKKGDSKEHMDQLLKKVSEQPINATKKFEATKFCGIVKFNEDPLEIQNKMRDEGYTRNTQQPVHLYYKGIVQLLNKHQSPKIP
ncbi:hypothetical protein BH09BAC1_BH09BAC1_22200 [soil metagenome]